jgi:molybdate transport system substrate-binding protein
MVRRVCALVACLVLLTACSDDGDGKERVSVFAASSLVDAFAATEQLLETSNSDLEVTPTFAGSQALTRQIVDGAPAGVFASADEQYMQDLVAAGAVESPQVFARNRLAIAVPAGNPEHIGGLEDLLADDVVLVLGAAEVPVGKYARAAFAKAGLDEPHPASEELDAKAVLRTLTSGEADAVVVYETDIAAAGNGVERVAIPDAHNVIASYPIAIVKGTKNREAAALFVAAVLGPDGQRILREHGFLPPSG